MENEKDDILINQGAKKASIHTVNEDISNALSGSSAKTVSDAIYIAKKQKEFEDAKTLASTTNKMWFILTIIVLLSSAGFLIWTVNQRDKNITIEPIPVYQGLVTYDDIKIIGDFETKSSLLKQKFTETEKTLSSKGLVRFRFKNIDPVSAENLIKGFDWKLSPKFTNGIETSFDFGVYVSKNNGAQKNSPFILFKTDGSDQSFSGFSLWEDGILFDLGEIFKINAQTALDPIYQKRFENITIESHDGRVLYDADGQPLIIMIFIDENHALVTNSKEAVVEVLKRVMLKK